MRHPRKNVTFPEDEERILADLRYYLWLTPGKKEAQYRDFRSQLWKLTSKGCDLQFLANNAATYAQLHSLDLIHRDMAKLRPTTGLEKRVASVASASLDLCRAIRDVQVQLDDLRRQALGVGEPCKLIVSLIDSATLQEGLGRLADGLEAHLGTRKGSNRSEELKRWKSDRLIEMVRHVKERGVKQFWKPLASLVSHWVPDQTAMEWKEAYPNFSLLQSPVALRRSGDQLRKEYERAVEARKPDGAV